MLFFAFYLISIELGLFVYLRIFFSLHSYMCTPCIFTRSFDKNIYMNMKKGSLFLLMSFVLIAQKLHLTFKSLFLRIKFKFF